MKLPSSWATETPIPSSSAQWRVLQVSLSGRHMRKLAQCDEQFRLNEGFILD
jgi:hypothetical protein